MTATRKKSPLRGTTPPPAWKGAIVCAAAALAAAGLALVPSLSIREWKVSGLVRMTAEEPMARIAQRADAGFAFVPPPDHYDGVYYYGIARDPFATATAHRLMDQAAYRYVHPGYGWLAGVVSLGRATAVPGALLAINLVAFPLGAFAMSLVALDMGRSPLWGLLVACNPGLIFAVTVDTAETTLVAVAAFALLYWLRGRWKTGGAILLAASLVREQGMLLAVGLGLYELAALARRSGGRRLLAEVRKALPRLLVLGLSPVLYGSWWIYLRARFGVWPVFKPGTFTVPPLGVLRTMRNAAQLALGSFDQMQVGMAALPILVAVYVLVIVALVRSLRLRSPLHGAYVPLAVLALSLNWWTTLYPKELMRIMALPVTILSFALRAPSAATVVASRR